MSDSAILETAARQISDLEIQAKLISLARRARMREIARDMAGGGSNRSEIVAALETRFSIRKTLAYDILQDCFPCSAENGAEDGNRYHTTRGRHGN